jgi:hypothetical protein
MLGTRLFRLDRNTFPVESRTRASLYTSSFVKATGRSLTPMETNRRAAAVSAIASLRDEYFLGQTLQAQRMGKLLGILAEHGFSAGLLVPPDINVLEYHERSEWRARCEAINADLALHTARARERWPELKTASAKE